MKDINEFGHVFSHACLSSLSVHGGGGSHVTIIHDALCLTVVDYEAHTVIKWMVRILLERFLIVNVSRYVTSIQKCSEVVSCGSDLGRAHVLGVYGSNPILSSTILAQ